MESREESSGVKVRRGVRTWALRLELDGAPIPLESQRAHATHLVEALEQPLLFPIDIEGLRHTKEPDLFMSLKRDLAIVSQSTSFFVKY